MNNRNNKKKTLTDTVASMYPELLQSLTVRDINSERVLCKADSFASVEAAEPVGGTEHWHRRR